MLDCCVFVFLMLYELQWIWFESEKIRDPGNTHGHCRKATKKVMEWWSGVHFQVLQLLESLLDAIGHWIPLIFLQILKKTCLSLALRSFSLVKVLQMWGSNMTMPQHTMPKWPSSTSRMYMVWWLKSFKPRGPLSVTTDGVVQCFDLLDSWAVQLISEDGLMPSGSNN